MAGEQRQGWKQQSSGRINNVRGALLCLQPRPGLTHSYVSFSFVTLPSPCRQPVTKNTFRHYRVLGKGGFGEVSVSDNNQNNNNSDDDDDDKRKCLRHCWRKFGPSASASGEMRL